MLDVVCWKWRPPAGYRSQFDGESVNKLRAMVARHLRLPHRFSCITDDATGIDGDVRIIPLWDDHASIPNPSNRQNPSCYRRLKMFSADAADVIGSRIVSMDLDVVITGDLTPLFDRRDDFIIWGGQSVQPGARRATLYNWYNGSLMMLRAGTRTKVWDTFDPARSPSLAHRAGCRGSDQGWISYCLGPNESVWGTKDGVYSFRNHIVPGKGILPSNARFIAFHGRHDPWQVEVQRSYPWVAKHYRGGCGATGMQGVLVSSESSAEAVPAAV